MMAFADACSSFVTLVFPYANATRSTMITKKDYSASVYGIYVRTLGQHELQQPPIIVHVLTLERCN
eukprot:m.118074 g.118074  ORF g.118074 m.118074 type:complete len:66 (+) comp28631_c0_seq1:2054-2251(+)